MLRNSMGVAVLMFSLAACAPMPPVDPQKVQIEGTAGMSVIYLVRSTRDWGETPVPVYIDGRWLGATHAGTYYRLEVPAGRHQITGFGIDNGSIAIDTQPNGVYFVEQHARAFYSRQLMGNSSYTIVDSARARAVMADAERMEPLRCGLPCAAASVEVLPIIPQQ